MSHWRSSVGLSLIEVLTTIVLTTILLTVMGALLVQGSRTNSEQLRLIEVQSSARTSLALVSQAIRTAGWDPDEIAFAPVTLDTTTGDGIETLDVFADLNGDGDLLDAGESITIRHVAATDRIEWRQTPASAWETIAIHITNDANNDGVPEQMFTPDASPNPGRLTIRITAGLQGVGPQGRPLIYSVVSDVLLRNQD